MRTLIFKGFFSAVGCLIVAVEKIGVIWIPGDFDGICFIFGMIFKFLNSWCSKISDTESWSKSGRFILKLFHLFLL